MSFRPPLISRLALWALAAAAAAAIMLRLALAFYAFPSADDYCLSVDTRDAGFWDMQVRSYLGWTGRYSAILLESIVVQFDLIAVYRWFALSTLIATVLSIGALVRAVCGPGVTRLHVALLTVTAAAVFAGGLPSTVEAFYWLPGQASYQWGVIVYFWWVALLIQLARGGRVSPPGASRLAVLIVLTLLAPGFNEIMAPMLVATIVAFLAANRWRPFVSERLLLTLLAVVVVLTAVSFLAPGNANRSSVYPDIPSRHNLGFALVETARQTMRFILRFGAYPALWLGAVLAWWWGSRLARPAIEPFDRASMRLVVLAGLVGIIYLTLFPVYWEYGEVNYTGEGRTYNVTYVVLCALIVFVVWWLLSAVADRVHRLDPRRRAAGDAVFATVAIALAVLMILTPTTLSVIEAFRTAPAYLAAERERVAVLAESPRTGVVFVDAMTIRPANLYWGDIQTDTSHWINICVARYFGLESVRTRM